MSFQSCGTTASPTVTRSVISTSVMAIISVMWLQVHAHFLFAFSVELLSSNTDSIVFRVAVLQSVLQTRDESVYAETLCVVG